MKIKSTAARHANTGLPEDLNNWFSEHQLLGMVLDAVQAVEVPTTRAVTSGYQGLRPKMMLTLLTYCYATNRVASDDVVRGLDENATVRYICAHRFPKWTEIRLFRRHNREELRRCLTQVYQQAWAARMEDGQADFKGYDWFEEVLRADIDHLVDHKLQQAILLDWANLED